MSPEVPAGWYADPENPGRWRWWDGQAWTQNVSAPTQPSTPASGGPLWAGTTLWVDTRARVGSWEADVADEAGAPAGRVRGGMEMVLSDAAGAPALRVKPERVRSGAGLRHEGLGRVHVSDGAGTPVGTIEVVKYVNGRVTLSLRDPAGQELGVLSPEAKNDREFALHDPAGTQIGRVVAVESQRKLLSQDRKWWVSLSRPLPQPLDSLALGVATTLSNIQLMVVNWHDTRFDND